MARDHDDGELDRQRARWGEAPTWPYEAANYRRYQASGGKVGLCIVLDKAPPFWSRGPRGCDRCGGDLHHTVALEPFEERRGGEITRGWRCRDVVTFDRRRR